MRKEQLLRRNRAGRIDDDLASRSMSTGDEWGHVREDGGLEFARFVALLPQVALERLEVGSLDVSRNQVTDVGAEGFAVIAILVWERIAIAGKAGTVPVAIKVARERVKRVRKLAGGQSLARVLVYRTGAAAVRI